MSDQNGSATTLKEAVESKGKGKAVEATTQEVSMDEGGDSSSEEEIDENEPVVDEPDEDNMEEIDPENILPGGRRTRGAKIDFVKAAQEMPEEDEDEDEDDDFVAPPEDEEMKD